LIDVGGIGVAYRDLEAAEEMVATAGRRWLAVRPVTLLPGRPTSRVGPVERYGLLSTVRRSDVAAWMVGVADGRIASTGRAVLLGRS
jgi:predicted RNA polymerase sigma factor